MKTTDTKIAQLNDSFRRKFPKVMLTQTVSTMSHPDINKLIHLVQTFDSFTEDNDPYGEHDFGSIEMDGETYFWKIDYYDLNLQYGSENPADSAVTKRIMTIMHSSEY